MFYEPKSKKSLFENSPGGREPSCFIVQTGGRTVHETLLFDLKSAQNARVVTILHPKPEAQEQEEHGKLQPEGPAVRRHSSHALAASPRPLARTTRTRIEIDFPVLGEAYRIFSPPKPPIHTQTHIHIRHRAFSAREECPMHRWVPGSSGLVDYRDPPPRCRVGRGSQMIFV